MKNVVSFIFLLILLVSGCSQEEMSKNGTSSTSEGRVFTTSFEQNDSRTYVEEGHLSRWTEGDRISLFDASTLNCQYLFAGDTGDSGGTFFMLSKPEGTGTALSTNYAVYPYSGDVKMIEDGVISVTLPSEQHYAENSYGLGDNTMVAVTENADDTFLKFKNICGGLKVQLHGDNLIVKTVTLTGNNGEKIAGKAMVTAAYDKAPVVTMADDATQSITLDCGEKGVKVGTSVEEATPFWIVIPPTTFEKGVTVKVMDTNGNEFVQTIDKQVVIERNVVNRMTKFKDNNYAVFYNENGWDESMYFVNGSQVHMKKDETTGNLSNIFAWVIDKNNDLHPVLAEMNEDGMPSKIAYANVDIMISRYDDTTLDMAVFVNDNLVLQADGVVHGLPFSTDSRAWKDNNGWRNTVAVITLGLSVVEIVGSGAAMVGCVASGQLWGVGLAGLGIASGIADFKESYDALFNSPEAVSDDWNSAIRDLSDNSIDMGKELQNKDSKLYKMLCERQSLKDLDVKWSDVKPRGLASLLLSLVDKFFGKTYNSIDQILEFKKHVSVITSLAEDVTASSAQVSAFYSYENTGGVSDINMVPGMRFYKSGDPKASWDLWEADWTNGHEYKYKLNNLEEYTTYSYVEFYHETVHDWYFFGNERSFRTKDLDDLTKALVKLYQSTNGDNWTRNDNWLDFNKPITEWYGILQFGDNHFCINLFDNNLVGIIDQTFPNDFDITLWVMSNQLNSLNVSGSTSLKDIKFENNPLTSVDVSECTDLDQLSCNNVYQLTSLNVSGCTALEVVSCYDTPLTSLDFSGCTALKELGCTFCKLTSLDISDCTTLENLTCESNQLTSLDVSGCTALKYINCNDNKLSVFNASGCTSLVDLHCMNNKLTSLDISGCIALERFAFRDNPLTSLDISGCTALVTLTSYHNLKQSVLASINASNCTSLKSFQLLSGQLTSLDFSGCTALEDLNCCNNQLTSLNVSGCTALKDLNCLNNQLTSLNVSNCSSLKSLWVNGYNSLKFLDVSGCTALDDLSCNETQLTSLNVSGLTALMILSIKNTPLTSLNVSGLRALKSLSIENTPLTSLNVASCLELEALFCNNNQITSLDVSGLKALKSLSCGDNPLSSLNASNCTSLVNFRHNNGQLVSLNVSGCTALKELDCSSNQLTTLDVSGCTALKELRCSNNKINSIIPDWFSRLSVFTHDVKYIYSEKWSDLLNKYVTIHEAEDYGWWYPGEPEKGKHSPD